MQKQVLAFKSYKYMIQGLFIIFLELLVLYLSIYQIINAGGSRDIKFGIGLLIIFVCSFAPTFIYFIPLFLSKKQIIEYDNYGIYINYSKRKIIYLRYKDIDQVSEYQFYNRRLFSSSILTTYGTLIIQTKSKEYKIKGVEEVENATKFIKQKIMYKYFR